MYKNAGFTLIELLVVVLIIGILAAVAVPQYTKVVEKSRAAKMIASARKLHEAQQRYYMANGTFAQSFDELDVDFGAPVLAADSSHMKACAGGASFGAASSNAMRDAGDYEIAIGKVYSDLFSVAYHKKYCAAVFLTVRPFQGLQDDSAIYCVSGDYVWEKKDWCSKTFGTNPSKDSVGVHFTGHTVKLP